MAEQIPLDYPIEFSAIRSACDTKLTDDQGYSFCSLGFALVIWITVSSSSFVIHDT